MQNSASASTSQLIYDVVGNSVSTVPSGWPRNASASDLKSTIIKHWYAAGADQLHSGQLGLEPKVSMVIKKACPYCQSKFQAKKQHDSIYENQRQMNCNCDPQEALSPDAPISASQSSFHSLTNKI
jgi:hypothetical protein